jgi:hypothetical protein
MIARDELDDQPLGGWRGEFTTAPPQPPRVPPTPLVIEPPDWEAELAERPDTPADAAPVVPAYSTLVDYDPPELPGPPVVMQPLARFVPPEPDWRAEEVERERQRAAEIQNEIERPQQRYPAKRRIE